MDLSRHAVLWATLVALAPTVALACACCDGEVLRQPVAWSDDGKQLLVHRTDRIACGAHHAVEVWGVGAGEPSLCYDLLGDPTVPVACDAVLDHYADGNLARTPLMIGDFALPAGFSRRPEQHPDPVHVRVSRPDPVKKGPTTGEVLVERHGEFLPLWIGPLQQAHQDPPDNTGPILRPPTATLWPHPDGGRAAVFIDDAWEYPNWVTTVVWVDRTAQGN